MPVIDFIEIADIANYRSEYTEKYDDMRESITSYLDGCNNKGAIFKCKDCGQKYFKTISCGHRLCFECARRYSNRITSKFTNYIKELRQAGEIPREYRLRFITLTLKKTNIHNDVDRGFKGLKLIWDRYLGRAGENYLKKAVAKLAYECGSGVIDWGLRGWRKRYNRLYRIYHPGAIACLELSPSGMIHWHMLYLGPYIPQPKLRAKWLAITGDSHQAWVTGIGKDRKGKGDNKSISRGLKGVEIYEGIREICKYIHKFLASGEGLSDQVVQFYTAIQNHRRIRTLGRFYNIPDIGEKPELVCEICGGAVEFLLSDDLASCEEWEGIICLDRAG